MTFSGGGLIFGYSVGQKAQVLYKSGSAQQTACLASTGSLWFLPTLLAAIGLAWLFVSAGQGASSGGAAAPTSFPNAGWIWKTAACRTPDLTHEDFCGPTIFGEVGASILIAGTGNAMSMGFDKILFAEMMATSNTPGLGSLTMDRAMSSVKAVLVSTGFAISPSAQVGAAAFTGYIW